MFRPSKEIEIEPSLPIPARYEPDISLGLSHLQPVCLAHDMTGSWLVEICYDHLGSSLLQVPQVLVSENTIHI